MSLEQHLQENTAALERLSQLFTEFFNAQAAVACNTASLSPGQGPCVPSPQDDEAVQEPASDVPSSPSDAEDVIPYSKVREVVTHCCNVSGREPTLEALNALGLASAKEANPDQYAAIIAACEALTAKSKEA